LRYGLDGDASTAIAGLSSAADVLSGLTSTGDPQAAFEPEREATKRRGWPVLHGVVRMNE
jgi:hypothetical protein